MTNSQMTYLYALTILLILLRNCGAAYVSVTSIITISYFCASTNTIGLCTGGQRTSIGSVRSTLTRTPFLSIGPVNEPSPIIPCGDDNCFRAMLREGSLGSKSFCQNFTAGVTLNETTLPTYASMCEPHKVAAISSACSCLVGASKNRKHSFPHFLHTTK